MLGNLLKRLAFFGRVREPAAVASAFSVAEADRLIAAGNRAEGEGRLHEACGRYRKAVEAAPVYSKAHLNLGIGLEAMGDADGAVKSYEAALAIDPANAYASYNLGKLLYVHGALPRAEELLRSALAHKAEFPEAQVALANVYASQGSLDAAAAALEAALDLRPDWPGALFNYGTVLSKLGRTADAEAALRRVVASEPENADASYHLANLLYARGALQEAEEFLRRALERKSEFPEAYGALFHVYDAQGNLTAAAAALEGALKQRPDWAGALHNYAIVLTKLRRLTEAEAALRRAIAISPDFLLAYRELGAVLFNQSRVPEALEIFRAGRRLDPERFDLESAELFTLNFTGGISSDALFARHRAFGARIEKANGPRFKPFRNVSDPERRLRIGYVSGDFNHHPVAFFLMPLLERHDRSAYEAYCYSVGAKADNITRQVQARAAVWRNMASMPDARLADTINQDGIDILVDLSGHAGEPRLGVFAQFPAPVQVTWLGYPNTTGLTRIQYRLTDRYADPPELSDHLHTEMVLRLPGSQWCYRPAVSVDIANVPPCERNGYITFGSFNQGPKLSPAVRKIWAEVLARLPGSRLVVAGVPEGHARASLLRDLGGAGVATGRIAFVPPVAIEEYFRRFNSVDIALDPTPYSGCTTTCDTLWMGVPVITLAGAMPASRTTAGILSTVGLADWIAPTPEDYVRLAIDRAGDEALLAELLGSLRQRMRESPLMDELGFARDMENAFRQMWRAWCHGR